MTENEDLQSQAENILNDSVTLSEEDKQKVRDWIRHFDHEGPPPERVASEPVVAKPSPQLSHQMLVREVKQILELFDSINTHADALMSSEVSDDLRGAFPSPELQSADTPATWHQAVDTETPLARSQAAYVADLPELLQRHRGRWVAYADGKQLRFGKTQTELYQHCLNELGLTHDRFVVRLVVPECDPEMEYNLR